MSNIVENQQTAHLFTNSEYDSLEEICMLSSVGMLERLEDFQYRDEKKVNFAAHAVLLFSIRRVLEEKTHPWKPHFKGESIQEFVEAYNEILNHVDEPFPNRKIYPYRKEYEKAVFKIMSSLLKHFLTDSIREIAVSQHARNMSTGNVARYFISVACEKESVFYHIIRHQSNLESDIVAWLTPRLAYLKVGTPSFPVKYRELWHNERAAYLAEIKDVPLTNTSEQVKALSDLYRRLDDAFEASETDRGKAQLSASMVKCLSGLFALTRSFSPPQDAIEEKQ